MGKLFYLISFRWVKDLGIAYKKRRDRKRTEYCEKRCDMKLKGLR